VSMAAQASPKVVQVRQVLRAEHVVSTCRTQRRAAEGQER
jgi:hypothetical protein